MTGVDGSARNALDGRRILVVEDEFMIAYDIADALARSGATVLGPVARLDEAMRLIEKQDVIDAAVLDVNLRNEAVWPAVDALRLRDVPIVLATGYDKDAIPSAYCDLPRREKPVHGREIIRALAGVILASAQGARSK